MEGKTVATPITPLTGTPAQATHFTFDWNFVGSSTFWIVVIFGSIFGIIFFIYLTRKDRKDDPFMRDFKIKRNQCKLFRNPELKAVYIENRLSGLTKVGNYEGECKDKEGYYNVMFSRIRFGIIGRWLRRILFFTRPILDLILKKYWIVRCNINPIMFTTNEKQDKNGKMQKITKKFTLPVPSIIKGKGNLIIHCEGLQLKKYYTYPILLGAGGNIIKDEDKNFMRERDSVLIDTLYQQTIDFSNAMREAINLNPNVRYVVKTEGRTMPSSEGG